MFLQITECYGNTDALDKAESLVSNECSSKAVERLKKLYQVLCAYGVEKYVSFDLGMLSRYQYYTGIIFKVYAFGVGDVIVKGGRYDKLLPYFGKDSAAIGFVIVVDDLMQALKRQGISRRLSAAPPERIPSGFRNPSGCSPCIMNLRSCRFAYAVCPMRCPMTAPVTGI